MRAHRAHALAWEVEGADAGGHAQRLSDGVGVDAAAHPLHVLPHQVAGNAGRILHHLCSGQANGGGEGPGVKGGTAWGAQHAHAALLAHAAGSPAPPPALDAAGSSPSPRTTSPDALAHAPTRTILPLHPLLPQSSPSPRNTSPCASASVLPCSRVTAAASSSLCRLMSSCEEEDVRAPSQA